MAVVGFAQERPGSPQASFELGKHVITRKFLVETTSAEDGPIVVANAIGIPRLFQIYQFGDELHPYCRCRSIEPERMGTSSKLWEVTCRYETPDRKEGARGEGGNSESGSGSDGGGTSKEDDGQYENPLLALPEVETHFETKEVPIYGVKKPGATVGVTKGSSELGGTADPSWAVNDPVSLVQRNGANISLGYTILNTTIAQLSPLAVADNWKGANGNATLTNNAVMPAQSSAGEVFVPSPHMDQSRLVLTITRNEDILSPHPALALAFIDKCNSDNFWGASPYQVRCVAITAQRQEKQLPQGVVYPFIRATYTFKFMPTWNIQLLDKGHYWRELVTNNPLTYKRKPFQDTQGNQIEGLLDGNGGKLADGGTPVWKTIQAYGFMPFNLLNLPQGFWDQIA